MTRALDHQKRGSAGAAGAALALLILLTGCVRPEPSESLYQALGAESGMEQIVDAFILEIANDPVLLQRFRDSNVERFRQLITEHFCAVADGPCEYRGDSMVRIHAGMEITSAEFNAIVESLMAAMEQAGTPIAAQNRLLARLARLRPEIIRL